jgi:nitrogen regulatory protein P-II 1
VKEIKAIIRHEKLEEVRDALDQTGIKGITITEVKGSGHQRGYTESYRGAKTTIHFRPKIQLVIVTQDELVDQVIQTIAKNAHTGEIGDGKIFVSQIEEVIRIRTGEKGIKAL